MEHVANQERTGVGYRYLLERARKGEGGWRLLKKGRASQRMEWADVQVGRKDRAVAVASTEVDRV